MTHLSSDLSAAKLGLQRLERLASDGCHPALKASFIASVQCCNWLPLCGSHKRLGKISPEAVNALQPLDPSCSVVRNVPIYFAAVDLLPGVNGPGH